MPKKHSQKRTRGNRRTRRRMRGGYYSFNGALATGAADWGRNSEYGPNKIFADRGGNSSVQYGRGRKRGGRTRKMKGGGSYGATSASFEGSGSRGMIDVAQRNTKGPPSVEKNVSKLGAFNDNGAHGGNWTSFKGLLPK